jgi:phosphotransferase system HPr (HPr) family protein
VSVVEKKIMISNPHGLHARPASQFVQAAGKFLSRVTVHKGDESSDGRSIMGILSLGLEFGTEITLRVDGDDAEAAASALERILGDHG